MMSVKTIWLWRNIAKVVTLWIVATGALIAVLLATGAGAGVALFTGAVIGFCTGQVGIAVWPCWDFTIAPSNA